MKASKCVCKKTPVLVFFVSGTDNPQIREESDGRRSVWFPCGDDDVSYRDKLRQFCIAAVLKDVVDPHFVLVLHKMRKQETDELLSWIALLKSMGFREKTDLCYWRSLEGSSEFDDLVRLVRRTGLKDEQVCRVGSLVHFLGGSKNGSGSCIS
jgi:hypothetical protein